MFTVFTGPGGSPRSYLAAKAPPGPGTLWIEADSRFEMNHQIMRRLIPHLRGYVGHREVEAAIERHKPALSMVFGKLVSQLTPRQQRERRRLCARLDSNITHNLTVALPFVHQCCQLVLEVLQGRALKLVIPHVGNLDWCSQQVLKVFYKDFPQSHVECLFGFSGTPTQMEESGIVFRYTNPVVKSFLYSFRTVTGFRVQDLNRQPERSLEVDSLVDPYDDNLEIQMLQRAQEEDAAISRNSDWVLDVIESCFESYGYTSALFLGIRLLQSGAPLTSSQLARVHGIVALTAHNRQFFAEGNRPLADFLQTHYEAALTHEVDPTHRICLHYRLAVTCARRKRQLEPAAGYIHSGLKELEESNIPEPQRSCLDAWLRNIHSFVLMHQRNFSLAVEEHENAFSRLSKLVPRGLWANEVKFSTAVLAENLGLLFNLKGNPDASRHWYRIEEALSKKWPILEAVPSAEWQNFYGRNFMLKEAVTHATKGVRKAAATFHFNLEYFFILTLADLYYRMGNTASALSYFEEAAQLQTLTESVYGTPFLLRSGAASSALKSGDPERAQDHLDRIPMADLSQASQSRFHCLQAAVYAAIGDALRAETTMNQAIESAVDHGEQNLLVQVATATGEVCLSLGRAEEAASAFEQGWGLSGTGEENAPELLPATTFPLLVGMLNCGQGDETLLTRAIALAPAALAQSREPWWLLPNLLKHMISFQPQSANGWQDHRRSLAKIHMAASQRDDCTDLLRVWDGLPATHSYAS